MVGTRSCAIRRGMSRSVFSFFAGLFSCVEMYGVAYPFGRATPDRAGARPYHVLWRIAFLIDVQRRTRGSASLPPPIVVAASLRYLVCRNCGFFFRIRIK